MPEIITKRTANSKTFDLGKGRRQLVAHIGDIHYKDNYADPSELWKDIDLTWEGNRITKAPYELTREGKKLTFRDKKAGEVSTLELLESKPVGLKWEIVPEFTRVSFRHILPSDKVPFEAKFKVTGKIPFRTRASDDEGELELETSLADGILTEKLSSVKDKETGAVRPAKGSIRIDPTWQVGASTDDCYRRVVAPYWSLTTHEDPAGGHLASYAGMGCGMRFTNITIPQGATIDEAYLTLRSNDIWSGTVCNTRISAEDVDDAPTFADDATAFMARWDARTAARVDWDAIPAWAKDADYNSSEIKTVIKEIVDREGWASGQDIVIFWEDYDGRSSQLADCCRRAYSYDGSTEFAPKLVIEFSEPSTPQAVGGGAVGIAGVIARKISASFGLGSIAIAGSLIKQTSIDVGFNTVAIAGTLIKKTFTGVGSGAIAISGALSTVWTQVITVGQGAVTSAGELARATSTSVGQGAVGIAGAVQKAISIVAGQGSVAISGALIPARYYIKAVGSGAVSIAGVLTGIVVARAQAVGDGAIAIAGDLATVATHFIAVGEGTVGLVGNAAKTMYQVCGGAMLDIRGYITQRSIYKAIGSGAIAIAGSLDEIKIKLQSVGQGAVSIAGDLTKLPKKMVGAGAIAISGAVSKFPRKLVGSGAVTITGSVAKAISKSVGNALVSIWGRANAFVAGPPFRLILTFGQDWVLKLNFSQGSFLDPEWQLILTFKGGGK